MSSKKKPEKEDRHEKHNRHHHHQCKSHPHVSKTPSTGSKVSTANTQTESKPSRLNSKNVQFSPPATDCPRKRRHSCCTRSPPKSKRRNGSRHRSHSRRRSFISLQPPKISRPTTDRPKTAPTKQSRDSSSPSSQSKKRRGRTEKHPRKHASSTRGAQSKSKERKKKLSPPRIIPLINETASKKAPLDCSQLAPKDRSGYETILPPSRTTRALSATETAIFMEMFRHATKAISKPLKYLEKDKKRGETTGCQTTEPLSDPNKVVRPKSKKVPGRQNSNPEEKKIRSKIMLETKTTSVSPPAKACRSEYLESNMKHPNRVLKRQQPDNSEYLSARSSGPLSKNRHEKPLATVGICKTASPPAVSPAVGTNDTERNASQGQAIPKNDPPPTRGLPPVYPQDPNNLWEASTQSSTTSNLSSIDAPHVDLTPILSNILTGNSAKATRESLQQ